MRGLKTERTASVMIRGHSFVQNVRRGHYELAEDALPTFRLATASTNSDLPSDQRKTQVQPSAGPAIEQRNRAVGRDS